MIQHEDLIKAVVALHDARNGARHRVFLKRGGDDQLVRSFDLFFYCSDESNARDLAGALSAEHVERATVLEADGSYPLREVQGVYIGSVLDVIDFGFTNRLVRLACSRSAEYIGWMTAMTKSRAG